MFSILSTWLTGSSNKRKAPGDPEPTPRQNKIAKINNTADECKIRARKILKPKSCLNKSARTANTLHHRAIPDQPSRLLALPAELRNLIYEYALTQSPSVTLNKDFQQPALLLTCRQVRQESLTLYYEVNTFRLEIFGCDASLLQSFRGHTKQVENEARQWLNPIYEFEMRAGPNWANLVKCCQGIWDDSSVGTSSTKYEKDDFGVVLLAAHNIGRMHRERSWDECEIALENLRMVAGRLDERWLA